jgi:hypothetical protein
VVAVAALVLAGCGSDDGEDESTAGDSPTTEAAETTTTTEAATTTEDPDVETSASEPEDEATTSVPTTSAPTEGTLSPGDPCSLEEGSPDCIDPDGDGEGVYLIGGAECAANAPDISICEDLDGDGEAGYPDEFEDLPTCSADVPPPCNNPPGSSDDE